MIKLGNFRKNSVADEFVNRYSIATEKILVGFFGVKFRIISDYDIIKNCFEISQLNLNICAVIIFYKLLNLGFIGNIYVIDDYFFDVAIQIGYSLMNNTVHHYLIEQF